jgi:CRISPR-associated endonuclease Csn1
VQFASRQGKHAKLLLPDGNAYLEIAGAGGPATARVITLAEAATAHGDPSLAGTRRFYKGDTVMDARDGGLFVVKQIKASAGGKLILTPIFETRPVRDLKSSDGLKEVTGASLHKLVLADGVASSAPTGGSSPPRD